MAGMDRTMDAAPVGVLPGRRALFWTVVLWSGAAILAGTAAYLSRRAEPPMSGWLESVGPPALASALWMIMTVGIVWGARRFPPLSLDEGIRPRSGPFVGHMMAGLLASFVLNAAFVLIAGPGTSSGYGWEVARMGLANLHFNFGAYWIVALTALLGPRLTDPDRRRPRVSGERTLTVRSGRRRVRVRVSDIRWIEAAGDYVRLHVDGADHLLSERLKNLEQRLDPTRFVRVHRSAIVNVDAVETLKHLGHGDYEAALDDGSVVRIARTRREMFARALRRRELPER